MDTKMKNLCDLIFNEFSEQLVELRMHPRPFTREETCDTLNMDWYYCESYFIGLKLSVVHRTPGLGPGPGAVQD